MSARRQKQRSGAWGMGGRKSVVLSVRGLNDGLPFTTSILTCNGANAWELQAYWERAHGARGLHLWCT